MRSVTTLCESEIEVVRDVVLNVPVAGSNAAVPIEVKDQFFGLKAVRLRSVSAFFATDQPSNDNNHTTNGNLAAAIVKMSKQVGPRLVLPMAGIRWFAGSREPATMDGALIYNADPRGSWAVRVSAKGLQSDGKTFDRAATVVQRLIIRFRVLAVPDPEIDGINWTLEDRV